MGTDRNVHIKSIHKTAEFESCNLCTVSLQALCWNVDEDISEYRYVQSAKNALETIVRKSEPEMRVSMWLEIICLGWSG